MDIRTIEELTEPDDRTLRFTPLGLSLAGPLRVEDATAYQQDAVAVELVDVVPRGVQEAFERLRIIHTYGLLRYDLFTIAHQQAPLVIDFALSQRFMEYYQDGGVPLVKASQEEARLGESSFEHVYKALNGTYAKGWKLRLADGDSMVFKGSYSHLLNWARKVGLLHGQRNRRTERVLKRLRNLAAHPYGHSTLSPVDSARMIRDAAEIINRLWGSTTRGGRLYPAPIRRQILAVGWSPNGDNRVQFRAWAGREVTDESKTYILLRAVEHDSGLMTYDSQFETTQYPTDLLWGPGAWHDADTFLSTRSPEPDEIEYLDRLFLVRTLEGQIDRPRRPGVALGLGQPDRTGTWHLIRADHPADAYTHIRGPGGHPNPECAPKGPCGACAVTTLASGPWDEVVKLLDGFSSEVVPGLRVPSVWDS